MLSIDCVVGKGLFKYKDKTGNKNQQFVQIIINLNWSCKITFLFLMRTDIIIHFSSKTQYNCILILILSKRVIVKIKSTII